MDPNDFLYALCAQNTRSHVTILVDGQIILGQTCSFEIYRESICQALTAGNGTLASELRSSRLPAADSVYLTGAYTPQPNGVSLGTFSCLIANVQGWAFVN